VKRFVLDASVTLAWFIDPNIAPLVSRVQQSLLHGDRAIVPHLWRPEIANGFAMARKRGILTEGRSAQSLSELEFLLRQCIETVDRELPVPRIVHAALTYGLTACDATYLETARDLHLPLATLDQRLATAAHQADVPVIS
jgi:predicted nucleic acid-binding protein